MKESNSLNTSLSSVAQYASRLLMHSPDWDTTAVDYRVKERMAECVGGPPKPTPNVCRRPPSLDEENEATIRRGRGHGKEMSNSAMEPLPLPLPPTKWSLPLEQEDILHLRRLPTLPPLRVQHGGAARHPWRRHLGAAHDPPRISGAPGARMTR